MEMIVDGKSFQQLNVLSLVPRSQDIVLVRQVLLMETTPHVQRDIKVPPVPHLAQEDVPAVVIAAIVRLEHFLLSVTYLLLVLHRSQQMFRLYLEIE